MSSPPARSTRSAQQAFAAYVVDLMRPFAQVVTRPMFGGFGIYLDGLMFALIAGERLYFKADEQSIPEFERLGLGPFTYEFKGKVDSLRYHEAPAEAYDEPQHMVHWAKLAYACALRQRAVAAARADRADKVRAKGEPAAASTLKSLRGLGPKSQEMLACAGIQTEAQLRQMGAVLAYVRIKAVCPSASLNLLWALEGALSGRDWRVVAQSDRADLLMALEDVQRQAQRGR